MLSARNCCTAEHLTQEQNPAPALIVPYLRAIYYYPLLPIIYYYYYSLLLPIIYYYPSPLSTFIIDEHSPLSVISFHIIHPFNPPAPLQGGCCDRGGRGRCRVGRRHQQAGHLPGAAPVCSVASCELLVGRPLDLQKLASFRKPPALSERAQAAFGSLLFDVSYCSQAVSATAAERFRATFLHSRM